MFDSLSKAVHCGRLMELDMCRDWRALQNNVHRWQAVTQPLSGWALLFSGQKGASWISLTLTVLCVVEQCDSQSERRWQFHPAPSFLHRILLLYLLYGLLQWDIIAHLQPWQKPNPIWKKVKRRKKQCSCLMQEKYDYTMRLDTAIYGNKQGLFEEEETKWVLKFAGTWWKER